MRLEGTVCQHCSIIYHTGSEISWWFGCGGLAPLNIEYIAAIPVISGKGSLPVRTYPE